MMEMQSQVLTEKRITNTYKEESLTYKKQVENLLEELKDKSDSESFDDEKQRILNVKKAMRAD